LFNSEKKRTFALVIELERHIEILLLSNDCVIVPELGGFMAHHVDARFEEADNTFLPPLRTLGFNPRLTMNDSLLVQSYIEAYDISYPEALRRIEAEVAEIRQHLETEGEYELNDIGILRLNEDGNMEFTPCEAGILTPQLYGLSSFEMKPLVVEKPLEDVEKKTEDVHEPQESSITIKMSWLRNALAVAAAIIAFLMISTPISNSNDMTMEMQQSAFITIPQQSHPTLFQSADSMIDNVPANIKETKAADSIQQPEDEHLSKEVITPSFCIVLASQVTKKNAEIFISQLNDENFSEARLMTNRKGMLRVVYGNYASEADAISHLRELRSQSKRFVEAWIMEVKE